MGSIFLAFVALETSSKVYEFSWLCGVIPDPAPREVGGKLLAPRSQLPTSRIPETRPKDFEIELGGLETEQGVHKIHETRDYT